MAKCRLVRRAGEGFPANATCSSAWGEERTGSTSGRLGLGKGRDDPGAESLRSRSRWLGAERTPRARGAASGCRRPAGRSCRWARACEWPRLVSGRSRPFVQMFRAAGPGRTGRGAGKRDRTERGPPGRVEEQSRAVASAPLGASGGSVEHTSGVTQRQSPSATSCQSWPGLLQGHRLPGTSSKPWAQDSTPGL